MIKRCIIVGAGHAGAQAAISIREEGYDGEIVLLGDDDAVPYHKPPLSKAFLKAPDATELPLRSEAAYHDAGVTLRRGARVVSIASDTRRLALASGEDLTFTDLVLATGSRPRLPPISLPEHGVYTLRSVNDARRIRAALVSAERVVIVGGGFIGMELAHSCVALGKPTLLLEAAPRVLGRSVAAPVSAHVENRSRQAGIDIRTGLMLKEIVAEGGVVSGVLASDGSRFAADMVIIGIGATPETELAASAGLSIDNGIVVDGQLRTSVAHIYAIGDCANFPDAATGQRMRLESVQNATSQGRHLGRVLAGRSEPYCETPWFWSDQGDMKLQMAGLSAGATRSVLSGAPEENAFSIYHFDHSRLLAVDSVNRPADHMVARKLLEAGMSPTDDDIAAGPQRLREMAKTAATKGARADG